MKNIVWKRGDGGVAITVISDEFKKTSKEYAEQFEKPVDLTAVAYDLDLPEYRDFRNAWKWDNAITVDMEKAKEIHKERLRSAREPVLQKLDVEFLRAVELGDTKKQSDVTRKKQELRDVTENTAIINAQTPEELRAFWPKEFD